MVDSTYNVCKNCHQLGWLHNGVHSCKQFLYNFPDAFIMDEDEWEPIFALDSELAAELATEKYDSEEYVMIRNDSTITILIKSVDDETIEKFVVSAESIPTYSARKITD